jgi:hypothetical protein
VGAGWLTGVGSVGVGSVLPHAVVINAARQAKTMDHVRKSLVDFIAMDLL